jgi:hypothetical protein
VVVEYLDLDSIARVRLTSEEPMFPIEMPLSVNPKRKGPTRRSPPPRPGLV